MSGLSGRMNVMDNGRIAMDGAIYGAMEAPRLNRLPESGARIGLIPSWADACRAAIVAAFLSLVMVSTGLAQTDLRKEDGYVDVETMSSWFNSEPTVEVNIKGALLNLIAEASRFEDPDLAAMLHRLKAIQVRAYTLDQSDFRNASSGLRELGKSLERTGWETVVRAREDDEHVEMYLRSNGNRIAGMVVLALDQADGEAVMVNIVGEIDPSEIGRIGRRFNLGILDN